MMSQNQLWLTTTHCIVGDHILKWLEVQSYLKEHSRSHIHIFWCSCNQHRASFRKMVWRKWL